MRYQGRNEINGGHCCDFFFDLFDMIRVNVVENNAYRARFTVERWMSGPSRSSKRHGLSSER